MIYLCQVMTYLIYVLVNLSCALGQMWIGAINDQIWLPRAQKSDYEKCSNRLQFDLLLIFFDHLHELGQIMTIYVFQYTRYVILINTSTDSHLTTYFRFRSTFEFGQIITRYDFLDDRWMIFERCSNPPESRSDEGEIHLTWETIQNGFSRILYTLRHFNKAKSNVQSCRSWKPCEMDLSHCFSAWMNVRSMRETGIPAWVKRHLKVIYSHEESHLK